MLAYLNITYFMNFELFLSLNIMKKATLYISLNNLLVSFTEYPIDRMRLCTKTRCLVANTQKNYSKIEYLRILQIKFKYLHTIFNTKRCYKFNFSFPFQKLSHHCW